MRQLRDGQCKRVFVDVTACNGAQQCRTVPNVNIDTGATGLHLYRKALDGLDLDAVRDAEGRALFHGSIFGMGLLWGSMHWALVRLGGVATTRAIPIQLYQWPSRFELLPAGYEKVDERHQFLEMNNGILGIAPYRHWPKRYFAFDAGDESAFDAEYVLVDSGTNTSALDLEHLEIPRCKSLGTELNRVYDAAPMTPLSLTVSAGAVEVELARPLYVGPAANVKKACGGGYGVLPMLAAGPHREDAPSVLGLPFFYGRTVATGLQGNVNAFQDEASLSHPMLSFDVEETVSLYDDEVASVDDDETATPPPRTSPHGFIVYTD